MIRDYHIMSKTNNDSAFDCIFEKFQPHLMEWLICKSRLIKLQN